MNDKKKISINVVGAIVLVLLGFILAVGYPGKDVMLERANAKKNQVKQQNYIPKTSKVKKEKKKIIVTPPPATETEDDEGC